MVWPVPPADLGPAALAVAVIALLAGLARGFAGFGAAMVFIPIASSFLGPVVATPVLLITDLAMTSPLMWRSMKLCSWSQIGRVAAGAVIGFPLGVQILTSSDPVLVRWATTVLIGISLVLLGSGWKFKGEQTMAVSSGVGFVSGAMSGLAQVGGPPVVAYWLSCEMALEKMRATLIIYFAMLTIFGLAIFAGKELLPARVFWLAAAAAPGYALGVAVGSKLFPLASPTTFRWIAFALIALSTFAGMPVFDGALRGKGG